LDLIVDVKLRFITPCLGNVRERECDRMIKDKEGNVIFMQSWWHGTLRYGAKALNRFYSEVEQVQASPIVTGTLSLFKRFYAPERFTYHEAFASGDVISVSFSLPDRIDADAFRELLEVGGRYVGISPYGYRADYGRFAVVSVEVHQHHAVGQPDPRDSRESGPSRPPADVPTQDAGEREPAGHRVHNGGVVSR
jgi:hypothetical protein